MTKKKKKASKQVRISLKIYEEVRRLAFKRHQPMTVVLEEMINEWTLSS